MTIPRLGGWMSKLFIIPEINGSSLESKDRVIANPNCSTIQMLMALAPIHRKFKLKRIIISTYQSVTEQVKRN